MFNFMQCTDLATPFFILTPLPPLGKSSVSAPVARYYQSEGLRLGTRQPFTKPRDEERQTFYNVTPLCEVLNYYNHAL